MSEFDSMLRRMLAVADQSGLQGLAAAVLNHDGTFSSRDPSQYGSLAIPAGENLVEIQVGMLRQCYQELKEQDHDKLTGGADFMNLVTAFQRKFGPIGHGEPVGDDSEIANPLADGDTFLTVAEARKRGLWCDWHEQPHKRWGGVGDQAFCRRCHAFLQASLSPRQWRVLTVEWLGRMGDYDKQLFAEVYENWTEGTDVVYFKCIICVKALLENLTPYEVADRLRQESVSRPSVDEK